MSITIDHAPAVVALWEEQKRDDPKLTPQQFAEQKRADSFRDIIEF